MVAHKRQLRRAVDDRAAALFFHDGQDLVHRQERAAQVNVHHFVVIRLGRVGQQLGDLHARDVDQDVDAAVSVHGLHNRRLDGGFVGNIAGTGDGLSARGEYFTAGGFQPVRIYVHQEELRPFARQTHCRASADAGGRTRDHRDSVQKLHSKRFLLGHTCLCMIIQ